MRAMPGLRAGLFQPWPLLLAALVAFAMLRYAADAFAGPDVIQDDARQFLAWTARLDDGRALAGDLIADYWQSVSPPLYRALLAGAHALGVGALPLSRLLPLVLLPLTAWLAWRVARRIGAAAPVAFAAATAVMAATVQDDSIFTATPRGFMAPLFLLFLDGLLSGSAAVTLAALLLLAALYPAAALVALTMIGLSRIRRGTFPWLDLSPRSLLLTALGVAAVLAPMLLFRGELARWQPTLTLAQSHALPDFDQPSLRSAIPDMMRPYGWLCSSRMGFLPRFAHCKTPFDPRALVNFALLLPSLLLFLRALRRRGREEPAGELIYGWAFAAAVLWFALSSLVAFKLHLPSRFSQRVLMITGALGAGQLLGEWLSVGRRRWLGIPFGLVAVAAFATPRAKMYVPADSAAIDRLRALPPQIRIGGVSEDLSFVPALAGRSVLVTTEHAIPYHLGYYLPFRARGAASVDAVTTGDPARLADYVRRYGLDVIAVDRATLATNAVPAGYALFVPETAVDAQRPVPSALARVAGGCMLFAGQQLDLLDARCVATRVGG